MSEPEYALQHGMELSAALERGEPEYRFIKGKGWVPSFGPLELMVTERQVQVGDVLLQWGWKDGNVSDRHSTGWKVTQITDRAIGTAQNRHFHFFDGSSVSWFLVRRP